MQVQARALLVVAFDFETRGKMALLFSCDA
jgi:hypothetical protein